MSPSPRHSLSDQLRAHRSPGSLRPMPPAGTLTPDAPAPAGGCRAPRCAGRPPLRPLLLRVRVWVSRSVCELLSKVVSPASDQRPSAQRTGCGEDSIPPGLRRPHHCAAPAVSPVGEVGRAPCAHCQVLSCAGTAIESGEGMTYFVPITEGCPLHQSTLKMEVAGQDITLYLMQLLSAKGNSLISTGGKLLCWRQKPVPGVTFFLAYSPYSPQCKAEPASPASKF